MTLTPIPSPAKPGEGSQRVSPLTHNWEWEAEVLSPQSKSGAANQKFLPSPGFAGEGMGVRVL
jgi:hypothetical protein